MVDWDLWGVTALGFLMGYKAIKKGKERVGVESEHGKT